MTKTTILVITLVSLIMLSHGVSVESETSIDCGFLLALLNLELDHAINYNVLQGIEIAQLMLNMSLPSKILSMHRQVYRAFLDYFSVLKTLRDLEYTNISVQSMLRVLIRTREIFATSLNTYIDQLASCTVDRDTAIKLRDNALSLINIFMNTVYPSLVQSILYRLSESKLIDIDLHGDVFKPGESILIEITPLINEIHVIKIEIAHWPTLRGLVKLNNYTYVDNKILVTYRAPYLYEVRDLLVGNTVQLAVVVIYIFHNTTLSYAKLFEVTYGYPDVVVNTSSRVKYGEGLFLNLVSNSTYNFTVLVNNKRVLNTTLVPGINTYIIPFNATLFKIGYNSLQVIIDETPSTVKYIVEKSFIVETLIPHIVVQTPAITVGWVGNVPVTIVKHDKNPINLTIFINGKEVLNKTLEDSVYCLNVALNALFLDTLRIDIYFTNEYGAQVPVYNKEILYINGLSMTVLTIVTILLVSLVKKELFLLPRHGLNTGKHLVTWRTRSQRPLIKPEIAYSVRSKATSIYYGLLSKLRLPQPSLQETLREHYRRLRLRGVLAKLLWRILVLVERDLYSDRKPSYEEIIELVNEAEKVAGE